ncbi:MAG: class I SAM-dependent methyltransferase [Verrucomicrobia bacterium]|nr:class I SAM-dependent methyltransferase [Verrucomicrobiota bacterium]
MREDRPSETALLIALATVMLAHDASRRHLVAPGAGELSQRFLETTRRGRRLSRWFSTAIGRRSWRLAETLVWPGMAEHFWHRKRWIEARVRRALEAGTRRVVVAGAGFDTLALRLAPEFGGVDWIEFDHPASQRFKLRAMERAGIAQPPNLHLRPGHFEADTLPAEVGDSAPIVVVAEGLLMYLPSEAVREFLRGLGRIPGAGVELIFSFMRADVRLGRWVEAALRRRGEPLLWSIEPAALAAWLAECGLNLREQISGEDLARAEGVQFRGEDLAVATSAR